MKCFSKSWGTLMWVLAATFYFIEIIVRASLGVISENLSADFLLTATQLGSLAAVYNYAYSPLQIPFGLLLDRWGPRKLLASCCGLFGAATFLFALAPNYYVALIARFFIGAGSACAFIGCIRLVVEWFRPTFFPFMVGLTNAIGCLAGMVAEYPLAKAVSLQGWRHPFLILGGGGLALAFLIWAVVRDHPCGSTNISEEVAPPQSVGYSLWLVIKNPQIWLSGIVGGVLYLPLIAFAELWAIPFIQSAYGISHEQAALSATAIYVSFAVGSLCMPFVCKKLKSYKKTIFLGGCIAAFSMSLLCFSKHISFYLGVCLCSITGLAIGVQVLVFTLTNDHVDKNVSGIASAFTNCLIMFIAGFSQHFLGHIIDKNLSTPGQYTYGDYQKAIALIPVAILASFFFLFWVKDTYQNQTSSSEAP